MVEVSEVPTVPANLEAPVVLSDRPAFVVAVAMFVVVASVVLAVPVFPAILGVPAIVAAIAMIAETKPFVVEVAETAATVLTVGVALVAAVPATPAIHPVVPKLEDRFAAVARIDNHFAAVGPASVVVVAAVMKTATFAPFVAVVVEAELIHSVPSTVPAAVVTVVRAQSAVWVVPVGRVATLATQTYRPVAVSAFATNAIDVAVLASFVAGFDVAFEASEAVAALNPVPYPYRAVATAADDIAAVFAVAVTLSIAAAAS